MNELLTVEGTCHCGAIQVTARVDRGLVMACHCTDCQTIGGGPFRAVAICNSEHFAVEGEPKEYVKIAESVNKRIQAFCCDCGTQLYACDEQRQKFNIRTGFLNQSNQLIPKTHIFVSSTMPWITELDRAECLVKGPGSPRKKIFTK